MRILYVEDATFLAEAVKHNLEKQGITTFSLTGDTEKEERMALVSRFVSEERKSAATEISATLTIASADEAVEFTLERASRKKWDPQPVTAPVSPEWESLLPGAGVRLLAVLTDYLPLSEAEPVNE